MINAISNLKMATNSKMLDRMCIFASCTSYTVHLHREYRSIKVMVIRDIFRMDFTMSEDSDMVIFMDVIYTKEVEVLRNFLEMEKTITRASLVESFFNKKVSGKPLNADMKEVGVDILPILIELGEATIFMAKTMFNFEPCCMEVMELLLKMAGTKVTFPLTGIVNEDSMYRKEPETMMRAMAEIKSFVSKIMKEEEAKERESRAAANITTLEELTSYVSKAVKNLKETDMANYMRSRHETVVRRVQELLGLDFDTSDVDVRSTFGYMGLDSSLTPDIIYHNMDSGTYHIIDVAVTRGATSERADQKEAYYSVLAEGLSSHTRKNFVTDSLVMSISDPKDIYMPSFMNDHRVEMEMMQMELIEINNIMKTASNYDIVLAAFERKQTTEMMEKRKKEVEAFTDLVLKISNLRNKKAANMAESFTANPNEIHPEMCTNEEDGIYNRIKEEYKNFDSAAYYDNLVLEMRTKITMDKAPLTIKNIFKDPDLDSVIRTISLAGILDRERVMKSIHRKLPKAFKFPDLIGLEEGDAPVVVDELGEVMSKLRDGTRIHYSREFIKEDDYVSNRFGIGISEEVDMKFMRDMFEFMSQETSVTFRAHIRDSYKNMGKRMKTMMHMRIFEVAYRVTKLARNIIYMEGRRLDGGASKTVSKVFRKDGYTLAVMRGSRLTQEAQVRYKVYTTAEVASSVFFHSMHEGNCISESNWLSVSTSDLKTMSMMFEKVVALASHYLDCMEESRGAPILDELEVLKSEVILMPLIILMEMKRGTSTTSQYNRYILNSMLGYVSDKEKAVKDIMSEPVRSRVEAYIRIKQMDWALRLNKVSKTIWLKNLALKVSTQKDYDRLFCPAIFSNSEDLEFCVQMNDIYHGNLFQKDSGFMSHRSKAIISKTMEAEKEFLETRNPLTMNSDLTLDECFNLKDKKHVYSKDFLMLMGKEIAATLKKNPKYNEIVASKIMDNMHSSMMMTYSLKVARVPTVTLDQSWEQETVQTFFTMSELVRDYGTSTTIGIVSRENIIEAVFSMFPKAQIGGPREILIQSYKLRMHVKFLENFFEGLCSLHTKEMLTKGHEKSHIQSRTGSEYKKKSIRAVTREGKFPLVSTLIADASRWAPSFVMHMFLHFLVAMELPVEIESHFASVLRAFSCKVSMMPKSLRKKWDKKVITQVEEDDILQWAREQGMETLHTLRLISGMGQGMLHRFSSLLHCAKDDLTDKIVMDVEKAYNVDVEMVTMISSDDLMKQMMMKSTDPLETFRSLKRVMVVYETTNMLANVHTNWKKTALSFLLDEFNSEFATGKRAIMAVIKDVFTAMEMVDMTEPVMAVNMIIANIRRAFNNGMYLNTAEVMFTLMRKFMMDVYSITTEDVDWICRLLMCNEEQLPADLGFISTDNILGQLIFGPDILMYKQEMSSELKAFYRGVFTGVREENEQMLREGYMSAITGRIKLVLPYRSDKRLSTLKTMAFNMMYMDIEKIMTNNEKYAMYIEEPSNSATSTKSFMSNFFIGTSQRYEFSGSMHIHSLVRALQWTGNNMMAHPEVEKDMTYNIRSFVKMIMCRSEMPNSMRIMSPYKNMMKAVESAEDMFNNAVKSEGMRHSKKNLLRFRTREMVLKADTKEVISYMCGSRKKLSNRMLSVMDDLCSILEMSMYHFQKDPMMTVVSKLKGVKYPMCMFKAVLEAYVEARVNHKVEMMCSFADKGNAMENIVAIYCDRRSPSSLLSIKTKGTFSQMGADVCTWFSLGGSMSDMPWASVTKDLTEAEVEKSIIVEVSDGPLERMAKTMYWSVENRITITSNHVFYKSYEESRTKVIRMYTDLATLVMVSSDHKAKTHFVHTLGSENFEDMSVAMARLIRIDMNSEYMADYSIMHWNNSFFQATPATEVPKFDMTFDVSMRTHKWQFFLTMSWDAKIPMIGSDTSFVIINDSYTISSASLLRMSAEERIQRFLSFEMMGTDLSEVQELLENYGYSDGRVLGKVYRNKEGKMVQLDKGPSMTEELNVYSDPMSAEYFDSLMEGIHFEGLMEMTSKLSVEMNTENEESDIQNTLVGIDNEFLTSLYAAMEAEKGLVIYTTPAWERRSMNYVVTDAIKGFCTESLSINESMARKLFSWATKTKTEENAWNIIASQVKAAFEEMEDYMVRAIVVHIYRLMIRTMKVKPPLTLSVIQNYKMPMSPVVINTNMEEYGDDLMAEYTSAL